MAESSKQQAGDRSGGGSRLVVGAMLVLSVAAAVYAIWYLRGLSRRAVEYYGSAAGQLILQAPHIEAWRLEPAAEGDSAASEQLSVEGTPLAIAARQDVSQAPGITNVRRGLMNDASYDWGEVPAIAPHWTHALRFSDGDRNVTLLFSHDPPRAMMLGSDQRLSTRPVAAGLQAFFASQPW
jgi:hypothetical protein